MTTESPAILERLLRANDLGWMIDMYTPRELAVPFLLEKLANVANAYRSRFHDEISFDPETLEAESRLNPHKILAFLQALGASRNPDMLVMVWRILQGLSIHEVTLDYREMENFSLRVTLSRGEGSEPEAYVSGDIRDARLLRYFGVASVSGQPLFDGFYPLSSQHSR
jgi:hypothetical protein